MYCLRIVRRSLCHRQHCSSTTTGVATNSVTTRMTVFKSRRGLRETDDTVVCKHTRSRMRRRDGSVLLCQLSRGIEIPTSVNRFLSFCPKKWRHFAPFPGAKIAQLGERMTEDHKVRCSIHLLGAFCFHFCIDRIAIFTIQYFFNG